MEALRTCNICGVNAYTTEDLKSFCKSKASMHGYQNKCKLCSCVEARTKYNQKEYIREYRIKNKEVLKEKIYMWDKKWRANNLDKKSNYEAKRRAAKAHSFSVISSTEKRKIEILYKVAKIMSKLGIKSYHVDHILPLAKGGTHTLENLQILDSKANLSKGCKIIRKKHINFIRRTIMSCKKKPGKK